MRCLFFYLSLLLYQAKIHSQAFYTIIDDDAYSIESIESLKKLADKKNIKVSFAVIAQKVVQNRELYRTLITYQNEGFHICNHSYSHAPSIWKNINLIKIKEEIQLSQQILDSLKFKNHDYLVFPYGKFNKYYRNNIINIASEYFNLAFDSRGNYNIFNDKKFNKFYIKRFPVRSHNDWYMTKIIINKAIKEQGWIVFMTHSHMNNFSLKQLEKIIDYCQSKGLQAYTIHEAYNTIIQYKKTSNTSHDFNFIHELKDIIYMHLITITCIIVILFTIGIILSKVQL